MPRKRARFAVCTLVVASGAFAPSCREPTTVTLDLSTDVDCAHLRGVAIAASTPATTEDAPPVAVVAECRGAAIGTLTLVPQGAENGHVGVRVVAALDGPAESCTAGNGYRGCIVARRRITFVPHNALRVPIALNLSCKDVPCDEDSTCAAAGRCVSATVDEAGNLDTSRVVEPARDGGTASDASSDGGPRPTDGGSDGARSDGGGTDDGGARYAETSCRALHSAFPALPSGDYWLSVSATPSGYSRVSCDMSTAPGGWSLVLNYLHRGGSTPAPVTRSGDYPLLGSSVLGVDESSTQYWGHASFLLVDALAPTDARFFCRKRLGTVVSFRASGCTSYFRTGIGQCSGIQSSFVPYGDHTAQLPAIADQFGGNQGALSMLTYPFSKMNNGPEWHIASSTFDCDDYGTLAADDSVHRVWVY